MPWFRKHHTCPCGTDWWDEWDCLCNDRCPTCDAEIEPDEQEAPGQGGLRENGMWPFRHKTGVQPRVSPPWRRSHRAAYRLHFDNNVFPLWAPAPFRCQ
jgi:hypothetical protein